MGWEVAGWNGLGSSGVSGNSQVFTMVPTRRSDWKKLYAKNLFVSVGARRERGVVARKCANTSGVLHRSARYRASICLLSQHTLQFPLPLYEAVDHVGIVVIDSSECIFS